MQMVVQYGGQNGLRTPNHTNLTLRNRHLIGRAFVAPPDVLHLR